MKSGIFTLDPALRTGRRRFRGFSLVEVLVSMTILLGMLLIITQVISSAQQTWRRASQRLSQFREARTAFDTITRGLSQAAINSYRTYDYGYGGPPGVPKSPLQAPTGYTTTAELGIVMGQSNSIFTGLGGSTVSPGHAVLFQAPLGYTLNPDYRQLNRLMCVRGYYILFGSDTDYMPQGLTGSLQTKYRYRLWEYQPPAETNMVYAPGKTTAWTKVAAGDMAPSSGVNTVRPVAENILTLVLAPSFGAAASGGGSVVTVNQNSAPTHYEFNSYTPADSALKYHLPTSVQVVMVAIDEESAIRLAQQYGTNPPQLYAASFNNPAALANDLKIVRESLLKRHVNFRVFSSSVILSAANNNG